MPVVFYVARRWPRSVSRICSNGKSTGSSRISFARAVTQKIPCSVLDRGRAACLDGGRKDHGRPDPPRDQQSKTDCRARFQSQGHLGVVKQAYSSCNLGNVAPHDLRRYAEFRIMPNRATSAANAALSALGHAALSEARQGGEVRCHAMVRRPKLWPLPSRNAMMWPGNDALVPRCAPGRTSRLLCGQPVALRVIPAPPDYAEHSAASEHRVARQPARVRRHAA